MGERMAFYWDAFRVALNKEFEHGELLAIKNVLLHVHMSIFLNTKNVIYFDKKEIKTVSKNVAPISFLF